MTKLLSFRCSAVFATLLGVALAWIPLLAVHGVESALAVGLLLPPWVAATAAQYTRTHGQTRGIDLVFRCVGTGLFLWAIPVVILALSSLRIRQCAPWEGLGFMILGPAVGCALAACVGVWVGALVRRARLAPWLAAAVPIGAALLGLWSFYSTPTVYVFGAFAGYFPGAIYDDLVRIPNRYLTYRASMLIAMLALGVLFDALWDPEDARLRLTRRTRDRVGAVVLAMGALCVVVASYWHAESLGHGVTEAYVIERLGKTERGTHCVVHLPRETSPDDSRRTVDDCDFHVARVKARMGLDSTEPVTAYFFRSQREKKTLIGVGRTLIAKPWRREIYLQMAPWPHPVLGHEVVHAVLSEAGRGPFAVASTWGGLVPNPGIIEGAAVALAWDIRDGLVPDQWARIMLDRGDLPAADALMSLRFTSLPARRAYMGAGSLVRFLIETRGVEGLLRAYRTGRVDGLQALETAWHERLESVPVTDRERGIAEVALARTSIFSAVCPHELAKLRANLSGDARARDDVRMLETCRAILDIDDAQTRARAALIGALARSGDSEGALRELEALRSAIAAPKPIVAAALEAYADAQWTLGRLDEASAVYDELIAIPRTDGRARQAEVKKIGLSGSPEERSLIYQLMLDHAPGPVVVHLAQSLSAIRSDGLGSYLAARQILARGRYALALPVLEDAARRGLPTERLERELGRLLGVTNFALGRYDESAEIWTERRTLGLAEAADADVWLDRIRYVIREAVSSKPRDPSSAPRAAP